ncbi:hypothetical protein [Desulfobacula sp.]
MKILIVDNEQILPDQFKRAFEDQRYMVETALDGEKALDKLFSYQHMIHNLHLHKKHAQV